MDQDKDVFARPGQVDTPLPLEALRTWLDGRECKGTQREKLEMLRTKWLRRLSRFDAEATRKVLRGYFKSPKRRDDLAALLSELDSLQKD
jgi:hypothetical protein